MLEPGAMPRPASAVLIRGEGLPGIAAVVMQTSLLVLAGPEAIQRRIDYPEIEDGIYELEGVVSRKKQLLPYLTHCLAQAGV